MRFVLAHISSAAIAAIAFMVPWAAFVVPVHDWKVLGSSFLGSQLFALIYWFPHLLAVSLIIVLPVELLARRSLRRAYWVTGAWAFGSILFFGFAFSYHTHFLIPSCALAIFSGVIGALVYMATLTKRT